MEKALPASAFWAPELPKGCPDVHLDEACRQANGGERKAAGASTTRGRQSEAGRPLGRKGCN